MISNYKLRSGFFFSLINPPRFRGPTYAKSATDRRDTERSHRLGLAAPSSRAVSAYTSRCTGARTLYTLFCLREIPADSYSLERNKRYLSLPPSLPSLPLALSFSLSVSRKRVARVRLRGSSCHLAYYSTPLSSLADELPGAFLFTRATSCSPRTLFFFLVPPSPSVHGPLPSPPCSLAVLPQLLSFLSPFLVAPSPGPGHGGLCNT